MLLIRLGFKWLADAVSSSLRRRKSAACRALPPATLLPAADDVDSAPPPPVQAAPAADVSAVASVSRPCLTSVPPLCFAMTRFCGFSPA